MHSIVFFFCWQNVLHCLKIKTGEQEAEKGASDRVSPLQFPTGMTNFQR